MQQRSTLPMEIMWVSKDVGSGGLGKFWVIFSFHYFILLGDPNGDGYPLFTGINCFASIDPAVRTMTTTTTTCICWPKVAFAPSALTHALLLPPFLF
jgi:hypothetical protein